MGRERDKDMQSLRVSVPRASYIVDAFTTFLAGLDMDKPIQLDFSETNALRAIRHVSDGYSGIGVIRCKTEYQNYFISLLADSGLCWQPLLEHEYLVLISDSHPLARDKTIDAQTLHPYIEIIHGDTAITRRPS